MNDVWKSVIEADLSNADYTPRAPIPDGEYPVFVSGVEAKTYRTGSKGVQVKYTFDKGTGELEGKNITENFIIVLSDGKINRSGPAGLKKLMLACGLTIEQINKFKYPEFDKGQFGDFVKLIERTLTITVKQEERKKGEQAGKSFPTVKGFVAREAA